MQAAFPDCAGTHPEDLDLAPPEAATGTLRGHEHSTPDAVAGHPLSRVTETPP